MGDSLAAVCEGNYLFSITQKGKRKYLPLSQVDKPVDYVFSLFPSQRLFRISANAKGWGTVYYSSESSSDFLHLTTPTFLKQQRCSLPSILEDVREDVCKRFGKPLKQEVK